MKRMLLLFASILAMAASFTANAQFNIMVTELKDANWYPYNSPNNVTVPNVAEINVGILKGYGTPPNGYAENLADYVEIKSEKGNVAKPTSIQSAGMNLIISFDPAFRTPGTYSLTLKANAAWIDANGTKTYTQEFTKANLFTIEGTEPDPNDPEDPGTDPDDPIVPDDPVTDTYWYEGFQVRLEGYEYDLKTIRVTFPNLPAGATIIDECPDYTLNDHVYILAKGEKYYPMQYSAMITTSNDLVIYYPAPDTDLDDVVDALKDLKEGEYTLHIEADALSVDGIYNPELVWPENGGGEEPTPPTVTVNDQLAWELSWVHDADLEKNVYFNDTEDLKNLKKVDTIQIKMNKPESMKSTEYVNMVMNCFVNSSLLEQIVASNGSYEFVPSYAEKVLSGISLKMTFNTPIDQNGTYTLSLPEGLMNFGDNTVSAAGELNDLFTINSDAKVLSFAKYAIDPAENTTVTASELSKVVITFPNAIDLMDDDQEIEVNDLYTVANVTLRTLNPDKDNWDGEGDAPDEYITVATASDVKTLMNRATITFNSLNLESGRYELVIPAMFFVNNTNKNVMSEGIIAVYNVSETPDYTLADYTLSPEPETAVKELSAISLTFKYPIEPVGALQDQDYSGITLKNGEKVYECKDIAANDELTTVEFTFDNITENGTYTLTIPANIFAIKSSIVADVFNPEIVANFIVDDGNGVAAIFAGETSFTVVDAAGRVMMRDAENLNGLQPGLYIINGKKVLIRK